MKQFLKRLFLGLFPPLTVISGLLIIIGIVGFFFSKEGGILQVAIWSVPVFLISAYITHKIKGGWSDFFAWLIPTYWF